MKSYLPKERTFQVVQVNYFIEQKFIWHFGNIASKLNLIKFQKIICIIKNISSLNPFSANFTKWSNTLKQFVGNLPTNCLSVFDRFLGFALKELSIESGKMCFRTFCVILHKTVLQWYQGLLSNHLQKTFFVMGKLPGKLEKNRVSEIHPLLH